MELRYLREFTVLASVLKFQEAADKLFISQSSLSKHIMNIEQELGQPLFLRTNRSVQLTDFGRDFLPYAERLCAIEDEYTSCLLGARKKITVGHIPMVTLFTLSNFVTQHPEYEYSFIQGDSHQLTEWLKEKKVDFILTDSDKLPDTQYKKCLYASDTLVAVLPSGHTLASASEVSLSQLRDETFISFSGNDSYLSKLCANAEGNGFCSTITVGKERILMDMVSKGMGISVLTDKLSKHHLHSGISIVPIVPEALYNIYLIYPKQPRQPECLRKLTAYLKGIQSNTEE